jgi:hypothetical protein
MEYRLRKGCCATQQQAYWCELSKGNVKRRVRKRLGRTIHKEAEIMGKSWDGQANSCRKSALSLFNGTSMLQN